MHGRLASALLAASIVVIALSVGPAAAQRGQPDPSITDADVDALIQLMIKKLLATQEREHWIVQETSRNRSGGIIEGAIHKGKLLGVREGYVEIQYRTSGGKRREVKIPRELIQRFSKGTSESTVTFYRRKPRRGESLAKVPTNEVRGKLLKDVPTAWIFRNTEGKTATVPLGRCKGPHGPGHFSTKGTLRYGAGVSALATLALLKAGVDPRNEQMKLAIEYLRGHEAMDGREVDFADKDTYGQALRANIWEHLITHGGAAGNPTGYRKLLQRDRQYLEDAMSEDGWYTYTMPTHYGVPNKKHSGDHSNTQFGVLGMWAVATARDETADDYWRIVNQHWLKEQFPDGGWGYHGGNYGSATFTMTTAGLNSLFLVLDLYHSRGQGAYVRFNGIRPNPKAAEAVRRVFQSIDKGLEWMARHRPPRNAYAMYGLERLGVASGLKRIGGRDWYRDGAAVIHKMRDQVADMVDDCSHWGNAFDLEDASFWLMFLAYGRAPVVFNKLATSEDTDWNYYFRDLHYMCRFLTKNFERIYKWQTVRADGPHLAEDLADAPITYLAGTKKPTFTDPQLAELKAYLESGGTLVLHATRRNGAFAKGAREVFTQLFADRGYEFARLPDDHGVYNVHYGRGRGLRGMDFEGMSDGARTFIFLMPKDIAGAWQQNLEQSQRDLFEVMANLRIYAAPGYFELPSRLRPLKPVGTPAPARGTLRVARIQHTKHWNANPTLWDVLNRKLTHDTGLTVTLAAKPVTLKDAGELAGVDLLQLVGHGGFELTAAQQTVLGNWLTGGGMLLIDAAGGKQDFARAAEKLYQELMRSTGGRADLVSTAHKLITGEFPGGRPTGNAVYNRWGLAEAPGGGAPNLKTIRIDGRDAVLFSPLDLSATVNGHFIYELPAYKHDFARKLLANIAGLRFSQLHPPAAPATP